MWLLGGYHYVPTTIWGPGEKPSENGYLPLVQTCNPQTDTWWRECPSMKQARSSAVAGVVKGTTAPPSLLVENTMMDIVTVRICAPKQLSHQSKPSTQRLDGLASSKCLTKPGVLVRV